LLFLKCLITEVPVWNNKKIIYIRLGDTDANYVWYSYFLEADSHTDSLYKYAKLYVI